MSPVGDKKEIKEFKERNDKGTQSGGGGSERLRSQGVADGAGWWFFTERKNLNDRVFTERKKRY